MKKYNKFLSLRKVTILSASFLLGLLACKKDGLLTPDFAENTINAEFTDNVIIETSTRIGDEVLADQITTGLIGNYKDTAFGLVSSNVYVQPLLSSNGLIFSPDGETIAVDSIVLSLSYSGYYGDTTASQTFEVYRLAESLSDTSEYYSNASLLVEPALLGTKTFFPRPNSETTIFQPNNTGGVDTTVLDPQVRIKLDNVLANEIISKGGQTELSNNESFTEFFKGLYITPVLNGTPNNGQNAILYFSLTATNTQMTIYYTSTDVDNNESKVAVNFPINSSSVRFNTFSHDYSGSSVERVLQNPNNPSTVAYTEAMAGVETVVRFTNLDSIFSNNVIINKAELVLPAASPTGNAPALVVANRNDQDSLQFIPDIFESTTYFDGEYDSLKQAYTFNIARYMQTIVNGTSNDNGLTVLVTGSAVKADRTVLLTENNSGEKIKLNLYYTNTN